MTDTSDIPQDTTNSGESSENEEVIDIPEDGMKPGLQFPNEKCALDSIQNSFDDSVCRDAIRQEML